MYGAVCVAILTPGRTQPNRGLDGIHVGQGLMAGEVTQNSVILQSRLTSICPFRDQDAWVDRKWSGIPGVDGVGRFEISETPDFTTLFETEWFTAKYGHDYIIKTKIGNLTPNTQYYYRLRYGFSPEEVKLSRSYKFKTHPLQNSAEKVSFAVVTGMNYARFHFIGVPGTTDSLGNPDPIAPATGNDKRLGYPGLKALLEKAPDYFIATGDNVYYDTPGLGRAETEHQMRMKYQDQFFQARFINLFTEVPTYWMKDDHDYRFCDSDPITPSTARYGEDPNRPSHELGVRMFLEQLPVVDPRDSQPITYRTLRVNKHLQVWFIEGRDYRSPKGLPDGSEKSLWGAEQRAWLKRTLQESDATFKILLSPTPMVGPDSSRKRDNHTNPDGYKYEGEEFFRWLKKEGFLRKGFYIVCGDRHWQYHAVHPSGFEEFSVGTLVDQNASIGFFPGDAGSTDPSGDIKHLFHPRESSGGFLMFSVEEAEDGKAEVRFEFFNDLGESLYSASKSPSG